MVAKGEGWGERQGVWDGHVHTALFKMDNQQGPTIQHMELAQCYMAALTGGEFGEYGYTYMYG